MNLRHVDAGMIALVADPQLIALTEGDVAGRILVQQRVIEDRLQRADPPFAVDQRYLAETSRAGVACRQRPQCVGTLFGVDLDRSAGFETDLEPGDGGPRGEPRLGPGDP